MKNISSSSSHRSKSQTFAVQTSPNEGSPLSVGTSIGQAGHKAHTSFRQGDYRTTTHTPVRSLSSTSSAPSPQSTTPSVSLDTVFPHAQIPSNVRRQSKPPLQRTVTNNGISVVTEGSNLPRSYLSFSIDLGSRDESDDTAGMTHFLQHSLVRSTGKGSLGDLMAHLNRLGGDISTQSTRENLIVTATAPTQVLPVLELIANFITNSEYTQADLQRTRPKYKELLGMHSPDVLLNETLHAAAYGKSTGLGRNMYVPESSVSSITPEKLSAWHRSQITSDRISIAGIGVEHDSFVSEIDRLFGSLRPMASPAETPAVTRQRHGRTPSQYHGGRIEVTPDNYEGQTHVAFAFNAPGITSNRAIIANLLQMVLGGGASFSSGGPGKGMYSRLYRNVLGRYHWISNVNSFYSPYTDAGVFGIYGTVEPEAVAAFTRIIRKELERMHRLSPEEISRAKNMLRSQIIGHYEYEGARVEELARHIQLFNQFHYKTFLHQLDNASYNDIHLLIAEILESPMTTVSYGDSSQLPRRL